MIHDVHLTKRKNLAQRLFFQTRCFFSQVPSFLWFGIILSIAFIGFITLTFWYEGSTSLYEKINTVAPVFISITGVFIGIVGLSISGIGFSRTVGSKFVVDYYLGEFLPSRFDESAADTVYIKKLYIRNEKNKIEVIHKIILKIGGNLTIPLQDYGSCPLILEPFGQKMLHLDPVANYYFFREEKSTTCESSKKCIFTVGDSYNILYGKKNCKKNKVVIQKVDGRIDVEPNLGIDNSNLGDLGIFLSPGMTVRDQYGTMLSCRARAVFTFEVNPKPHINKESMRKTLMANGLSLNYKPENVGVQIIMMREGGEYFAQYYFLYDDKKHVVADANVLGWDEFILEYRTMANFHKSGSESFDIVCHRFIEFLADEIKIKTLNEHLEYTDWEEYETGMHKPGEKIHTVEDLLKGENFFSKKKGNNIFKFFNN